MPLSAPVQRFGVSRIRDVLVNFSLQVGLDEHGSTVAVGVVEQEVWMTRDGARKPVKMRYI